MNDHELNHIVIRSNARYDILIDIFQLQTELQNSWPRHRHSKEPPIDKRNEKGVMGICILRELKYFDVGRSFLANSLHNVYLRTFVRKNVFLSFYSSSNQLLEKNVWSLAQLKASKGRLEYK